jgi:hypothetical protein
MAGWRCGWRLILGEWFSGEDVLDGGLTNDRLHLDTRLSGLPEREVEIRQMTLWACVIYDK